MAVNNRKGKIKSVLEWVGRKLGLNLVYLIKNGNWVSLRFIVASLTGFFLSFFFAQFGTKAILGQYQLVLSVMSIVSICSFLGLNTAALEAVVHGRIAGVLRAAKLIFLFSLIGIPVMIGVSAFYAFFKHESLVAETLI